MEGLFHTERGPDIVVLGQPDVERGSASTIPSHPSCAQLPDLPPLERRGERTGCVCRKISGRTALPLLYYGYHIMVGLGTIFIAIMGAAAFLLWRRRLWESRWMLWILMLAVPFPFIANIAGWLTAEVGRQPWVVYNLLRTAEGSLANALVRQRPLHADRLYRAVSVTGAAVHRPGGAEDRPRPGSSGRAVRDT